MASNKSSSNNKIMVPQARAAMDKFKMEAANEVGVDLKKGYNGSMTTREAGSIGGQMVKKKIQSYEQGMSSAEEPNGFSSLLCWNRGRGKLPLPLFLFRMRYSPAGTGVPTGEPNQTSIITGRIIGLRLVFL